MIVRNNKNGVPSMEVSQQKVQLKIDGRQLTVPSDYTILKAAKEHGIDIPTLCFLEGANNPGACRICLVEVAGARTLQPACVFQVRDGLEVFTKTERVHNARKVNLELMLSNHDRKCLTCSRNQGCELQALAEKFNLTDVKYTEYRTEYKIDDESCAIVRDNNKCVLCRRCVGYCESVQTTYVIGAANRGFETSVGSAFDKSLADENCIMCGQCIAACPVGALKEKDGIAVVEEAIKQQKQMTAIITKAVLDEVAAEFSVDKSLVFGKISASLKRIGFSNVVSIASAVEKMVEGEAAKVLAGSTVISSFCESTNKFIRMFYEEQAGLLSNVEQPQLARAKELETFTVLISPCTAHKSQVGEELNAVLTTRELIKMIKNSAINFKNIPVDEKACDENSEYENYEEFGKLAELVQAKLPADKEFKIKTISGTGAARPTLDEIAQGNCEYHYIVITACEGGCKFGGGQRITCLDNKLERKCRH